MRRFAVISALTLAWCCPAFGDRVVREIFWEEMKASGGVTAGEVVAAPSGSSDPAASVRIENPGGRPKTVQVLTLDRPGIQTLRYAVLGLVRYADAAPGTHLEMWNYFPDHRAMFTRTLADSGPMRRLDGSGDWRPFVLPFFSDEKAGVPSRLELNVVFTGGGTVWLGPLRLVQYDANEDPLAVPGAWWSDRTAGLFGGIAGGVLGCLGGLIGTLGGLGKARRFVMLLAWSVVIAGIVSLVAGIVAICLAQPYAVYYPLLLAGLISSLVVGLLIPTLKRRYEQRELRRMEALDLDGAGSSR